MSSPTDCLQLALCVPQDGQLVTFGEVGGMTELNNHKPIRIKNCKVWEGGQGRVANCSRVC
jgi:hypothetical protein